MTFWSRNDLNRNPFFLERSFWKILVSLDAWLRAHLIQSSHHYFPCVWMRLPFFVVLHIATFGSIFRVLGKSFGQCLEVWFHLQTLKIALVILYNSLQILTWTRVGGKKLRSHVGWLSGGPCAGTIYRSPGTKAMCSSTVSMCHCDHWYLIQYSVAMWLVDIDGVISCSFTTLTC